uniref:Uncharacterized protein n=1 Tax=Pipistrellus kuhlii TaxID=59472 RepID=A0A7J7VB99_PIPKU|nr:hypothetical protein mPipKuh1_008476 [Pipistrellus kuhlii]
MDVQRGESRKGGRQPSGQPECIETTIAFNAAASLLPSHAEGRSAEGPGPEEGQHGDHHHEKARQKQNGPRQRREPPRQRGPGSLLAEFWENKHEAKRKPSPSAAAAPGPPPRARMHRVRPADVGGCVREGMPG